MQLNPHAAAITHGGYGVLWFPRRQPLRGGVTSTSVARRNWAMILVLREREGTPVSSKDKLATSTITHRSRPEWNTKRQTVTSQPRSEPLSERDSSSQRLGGWQDYVRLPIADRADKTHSNVSLSYGIAGPRFFSDFFMNFHNCLGSNLTYEIK